MILSVHNLSKLKLTTYVRRFACGRTLSNTKTNKEEETEDYEKPVKYSTSKAIKWKAKYTYDTPPHVAEIPTIQAYSVLGSVIVFMVYFCVLREENDVDERLTKTLPEQVPAFKNFFGKDK